MYTRIFKFFAGITLTAAICLTPSSIFAQTTSNNQSPNCNHRAEEINNLPVANNTEEYKVYFDIASLECQQTLIEKGAEFIDKNPNSQLNFPLYQKMVTAAIRLNNYDLAFEFGNRALCKFPDHMLVMTQLATIGSNQLLMGNAKYAEQGEKFGRIALKLIQAGKMPYGYMSDSWQPYKIALLGDLYQALGIFSLMNNCTEEAGQFLTLAVELNPNEPYTIFLLAKAQVQLYSYGARQPILNSHNASKENSLSEQIVNTYARAKVLCEDEKYQQLRAVIDYDVDTLSKVMPQMKTIAQAIETIRNEQNALAKPPASIQ